MIVRFTLGDCQIPLNAPAATAFCGFRILPPALTSLSACALPFRLRQRGFQHSLLTLYTPFTLHMVTCSGAHTTSLAAASTPHPHSGSWSRAKLFMLLPRAYFTLLVPDNLHV